MSGKPKYWEKNRYLSAIKIVKKGITLQFIEEFSSSTGKLLSTGKKNSCCFTLFLFTLFCSDLGSCTVSKNDDEKSEITNLGVLFWKKDYIKRSINSLFNVSFVTKLIKINRSEKLQTEIWRNIHCYYLRRLAGSAVLGPFGGRPKTACRVPLGLWTRLSLSGGYFRCRRYVIYERCHWHGSSIRIHCLSFRFGT